MGTMSNRHPAQMLFGKIDDMLGHVAHGMEKARDYLFSVSMKTVIGAASWKPIPRWNLTTLRFTTLLGTGNRGRRSVPCRG